MVTLGLAPPYAIEDVKHAYREVARATHPDRGGSAAAFAAVHEAFERDQACLCDINLLGTLCIFRASLLVCTPSGTPLNCRPTSFLTSLLRLNRAGSSTGSL